MKRAAVALFAIVSMILIAGCTSHDGNLGLSSGDALAGLSTADASAKAWAADAQLWRISGSAGKWSYFYCSDTKGSDRYYVVDVSGTVRTEEIPMLAEEIACSPFDTSQIKISSNVAYSSIIKQYDDWAAAGCPIFDGTYQPCPPIPAETWSTISKTEPMSTREDVHVTLINDIGMECWKVGVLGYYDNLPTGGVNIIDGKPCEREWGVVLAPCPEYGIVQRCLTLDGCQGVQSCFGEWEACACPFGKRCQDGNCVMEFECTGEDQTTMSYINKISESDIGPDWYEISFSCNEKYFGKKTEEKVDVKIGVGTSEESTRSLLGLMPGITSEQYEPFVAGDEAYTQIEINDFLDSQVLKGYARKEFVVIQIEYSNRAISIGQDYDPKNYETDKIFLQDLIKRILTKI